MPGIGEHLRWTRVAGCGGTAMCLLLLSTSGGALAQDSRANTRITEAECRNRATTDEQIVVCGQRSGENPYRIPKELRKQGPVQRTGTARAVDAMGSGIPDSGSNIGAAGAAGTTKQDFDRWRAERAQAKKDQPR